MTDTVYDPTGPSGGRDASREAVGVRGGGLQEVAELLEELTLALGARRRRFSASPSLKTISVGMLMTSKRRAMSGLSSTLSLAILSLPALLVGDLVEDRGDHLARTAPLGPEVDEDGLARQPAISSSKVASVRVVMLSAMVVVLSGRRR